MISDTMVNKIFKKISASSCAGLWEYNKFFYGVNLLNLLMSLNLV